MMEQNITPEGMDKKACIHELTVQVLAAEIQLTHFASRHGKDSPLYQDSLREFATAWYLLKKNRSSQDFLPEVQSA